MRPFVRLTPALATLSPLVLFAAAAHAQPQTAPSGAGPAMIRHADPSFGFELDVPAGWEYDRARSPDEIGGLLILRGRQPGGQSALQIVIYRIEPAIGAADDSPVQIPRFEDWVVEFGRTLGDRANAAEVVWDTWRQPPRSGAIFRYRAKLGGADASTCALCVPLDPLTVWTLAISGAVYSEADEGAVRAAFDRMVSSLKVHYDPEQVSAQAGAFERGRALLARLQRDASRLQLDESEHFYEMSLSGKSIGYFSRRVTREAAEVSGGGSAATAAPRGLRVRERSWRFAEDGTVRHTRVDLFSAFSFNDELMESELTQFPALDVRPQVLFRKTDQAIRKDRVIISSQRTSADAAMSPPSRPMTVGPVHLDLAWVRLLPMLMLEFGARPETRDASTAASGDAADAEPIAVATYSFETRGMVSHVIKPLGASAATGCDGAARAFEVREGLLDGASTVYCDPHGLLLGVDAGNLRIRRATRAEIDARYGPRRDEANKRFRTNLD